MKQLILIRHAKSSWNNIGLSDFDRPLNNRGKKNVPTMGQRLAERHNAPDLLLSSPAKRARKTAKIIAAELDFPQNQIEWCEEIYEADLTTLIQLIHSLNNEADTAILVGHNPGFSSLGEWLSPAAPEWLPTCGILELKLAVNNWQQAEPNCATLANYDYPKKTL